MMRFISSSLRSCSQLLRPRYVRARLWRLFCDTPVPDQDFTAAQVIWNYMILNHKLNKSDVILVLGNHDIRTADYASNLFLDGLGDWLVFSGKVGVLTRGKWRKTEAEVFRDIALAKGVPENRIILELQATNTGENVTFSHAMLKTNNLVDNLRSLILVQMPHMERRVYATFMQQWPGNAVTLNVSVTSPSVPLRKYPNPDVGSLRSVITVLMGCMYRIKTYPELGFQVYQHIPQEVWNSYLHLLQTDKYSGHIPQ